MHPTNSSLQENPSFIHPESEPVSSVDTHTDAQSCRTDSPTQTQPITFHSKWKLFQHPLSHFLPFLPATLSSTHPSTHSLAHPLQTSLPLFSSSSPTRLPTSLPSLPFLPPFYLSTPLASSLSSSFPSLPPPHWTKKKLSPFSPSSPLWPSSS